jgi:SagB-type dehydrogenase family enzyme
LSARRYHEATKHHFGRFARALGYLDWATQPDPFRRFGGSALIDLARTPLAPDLPYSALYTGAPSEAGNRRPIDLSSIGEFLRCSMGLSAWKQYGATRWALRVNPSSGNLHPTEAYLVWNGDVYHYAPREHALEVRALAGRGLLEDAFLVGLTSIHWREAWKYGERAFRYCQHDTGHAIAALRLAAAMLGWRLALLPHWPDEQIGAVLGVDRDDDFAGAEREEPECLAVVTSGDPDDVLSADPQRWVAAARAAAWQGRANRLSSDHVEWPIIDEVAVATRFPSGTNPPGFVSRDLRNSTNPRGFVPRVTELRAREVILQRRSAVAFNPAAPTLARAVFLSMLDRLQPDAPPWDAVSWPPQVHLAIFVHRVDGLVPGVYAYLRDSSVLADWKSSMRAEFLWEPIEGDRLFLLVPIECSQIAKRVSCDQDIAADGFFSLAMIARFAAPLRDQGAWIYRRLFWESGMIGQVLYLEAEAAGARATGIGCYYDDAVHELLGLEGDAWQSLYHFSIGEPVEDTRLTTEAGYPWE